MMPCTLYRLTEIKLMIKFPFKDLNDNFDSYSRYIHIIWFIFRVKDESHGISCNQVYSFNISHYKYFKHSVINIELQVIKTQLPKHTYD